VIIKLYTMSIIPLRTVVSIFVFIFALSVNSLYAQVNNISPFSKESDNIILSALKRTIVYPEIAAINNYQDDVFLCVKVEDSKITDVDAFETADQYRGIPVIGSILITSLEDNKHKVGDLNYSEIKRILQEEVKSGMRDLENLNIPEWQDPSIEFVVKCSFRLQENENDEKYYVLVSDMPTFLGGNVTDFRKWILRNLDFPPNLVSEGIAGKFTASFVIDIDGSITNVSIIRSLHSQLDRLTLEAFKKAPNWIPGKNMGDPVRMKMSISIPYPIPNE